MKFYGSKKTVVEFVNALLQRSDIAWLSITITNPEKFVESYVSIAIDTSSEDTVKTLGEIYFQTL
jgi:hypothetical protein